MGGQLWAVDQGRSALERWPESAFLLLTDADIEHAASGVRRLVAKAEKERRDLVSLMALLHCRVFWERLLVPAFVFFFQKLYPFPWVNDPRRRHAAAAGGCMLLRAEALARAGGIAAVRRRLIDDCAVAALIVARMGVGRPFGGHPQLAPVRALGRFLDDGGAHRVHSVGPLFRVVAGDRGGDDR